MPAFPVNNNINRFANLDGLRGIAALVVVVGHIERYKPTFGLKQLPVPFLASIGSVAVTFFFTLSGFIITMLLLKEKQRTQTIGIKNFYARRALRIFPVYFMVLLIGSLLYADLSSAKGIVLSVFFLSNIAFLKLLLPSVLYPIWSIGVEEQFYAVHPFIIRFVNTKKIVQLFLGAVFMIIVLRNLYLLPVLNQYSFCSSLHKFFLFTRYDTILVGCIAAYYFNKTSVESMYKWIFKKITQYFLLLLLLALLVITVVYDIAIHELYAFITALLIMNLCKPSTSVFSISSKPLLFLGKISYGLYLLHKFMLYLFLYLISKLNISNLFFQNATVYITVMATSIVLAALSYYFFENWFLKMKTRFV